MVALLGRPSTLVKLLESVLDYEGQVFSRDVHTTIGVFDIKRKPWT